MRNSTRTLLTGCTLLASFIALPVCADYSNTVGSLGPLGYWRFNEAAGSPALYKLINQGSAGSAGNAYLAGNAASGGSGIVGTSLLLSQGGSGLDVLGRATAPQVAALNPNVPFSVEFWAKPVRNDSTLCALSSMNCNYNGGSSRAGWLFYQDTTRWLFRLGDSTHYLITSQCSSGVGSVQVGTWQHVVGTYDGTNATIYLNGVLKVSVPVTGWSPNRVGPLNFGCLPLAGAGGTFVDAPAVAHSYTTAGGLSGVLGIAGGRGFDGGLDEVAIYNTLLSASKVAAHHDAATTNTANYGAQILADNPVGYWNCDDAVVAPPNPSTLPIATNSGSLTTAADGTNMWGVLNGQAGSIGDGFGAGNKAAFFDSQNGYIGLPDAAGLHFSGQITMMAWIKPAEKDFFRNIIAHGWDDTWAETFLRISEADDGAGGGVIGTNYYEVGSCTNGFGSIAPSVYDSGVARYPIPAGDLGNWVFLAGTYDGSTWNLYRNGQLVASTPSASGVWDVTNRWSIGSRAGPSGTGPYGPPSDNFPLEGLFFAGYIDEPAIFSTALTGLQISGIYAAAQAYPYFSAPLQNPGTVFKGASLPFSVVAEGAPTLHYSWSSNNVHVGTDSPNFTLQANQNAMITLQVVVTNQQTAPFNSATSSVAFMVVAAPVTITTQPQAVTRYSGFPFSFSVAASGSTPIDYYWQTNATAIPSAADSPSYSGTASAATASPSYRCVVSNEVGAVPSVAVPLTVVAVPPSSTYAGNVLTNPPIAYWRLGESSGTVANDVVGGHNGTYFNVTLGQSGYSALDSDTAAGFTGNAGSYVGNIIGDPALGGIDFHGHTNFTIEAWVNGPAGQNDESTIIAKGNGSVSTTANEQFGVDVFGGTYRFFTRGGGNSLYQAVADEGPNGSWQHVVGVYDDLNVLNGGATLYIYVNGTLRNTAGTRPSGLRTSSTVVSIGSKHLGNDPAYDGAFSGSLDEVAIYSYAMTATEVENHYAAAYGSTTPPTITIQPKATTNYVGLPIKLSVAAFGTQPLNYQWKTNGTDIPGANASTYSIAAAAPSDAGNYSVVIANGVLPNATSVTVPVVVLATPSSPPAIPGLVLHLPFNNSLMDVTARGNDAVGIHLNQNLGVTTSNTVAPQLTYDATKLCYVDGPGGTLAKGLHFVTTALDNPVSGTNVESFYASLNDRADLHFSSNANFTISFWVKNTDNANGAQWADLPFLTTSVGSSFGAGLVCGWTFGLDPDNWIGGWAVTVYNKASVGQSGPGIGGRGTQGSIDDGSWHNLVHVFDRQNGLVTYLDGNPATFNRQAGTKLQDVGDIDTGSWFTIGNDPTGAYNALTGNTTTAPYASGALSDLGIWRRALTQLEAAAVYSAGAAGISFTDAPILLTLTRSGANIILSWPAGTLYSAPAVTGPWVKVTPVSPLTVTPSGPGQFYRVQLP